MAVLGRVAHGDVGVDVVAVSPPDALALDIAGLDEVGNDALCRSLGDANCLGDVPQAGVRILMEAEEHLSVVGEEAPGLPAFVA